MACISGESFKAKNYERALLALNKCVDMLDVSDLLCSWVVIF
jgi:hypothetical protein